MLYLILWVFFAICCAILAARKGRSGVIWFILGLFFSFFALILLAVLSDGLVDEKSSGVTHVSNFQLCQSCGEVCDGRLGACLRCGNVEPVVQVSDKSSVSFESIMLPLILLIVLAIIYASVSS